MRGPKADPLAEHFRQLVERCLAGCQEAMLDLVNRYRAQVFGLCIRMLGNHADAEDAAQETFVRVLKSLGQWDCSREFEPWLLAIAGNRCRTALAARVRRPHVSALEDSVVDRTPDLQAAHNLAEEVGQALTQVRPEYRQAFLLFHEHELSYGEIAEAMNCPVGTVKTWVHRARREMIDFLARRGVLEESRNAVRRV